MWRPFIVPLQPVNVAELLIRTVQFLEHPRSADRDAWEASVELLLHTSAKSL